MRWIQVLLFASLVAVAGNVLLADEGGDSGDLHDAWDKMLREHVHEGKVDYNAIKQAPATLDGYLERLAGAPLETMSAGEKLAFWINAYNAFTVKLIVGNLPLESIRDIASPWKQKRWKVGAEVYSLDAIEHEILRKDFAEPRIHFAIVCASIGCPDLQPWAYRGNEIDVQLDRVTRAFMASPKHVRVGSERSLWGRQATVLWISKIFKWFEGDFTDGGKHGVDAFVALYAPEAVTAAINAAEGAVRVEYLDYDWLLNAQN